ncbi:acyl carrier protein [Weissella halotolerans]|uniref:Acyl carrier protein n=1 Tax=Weissella halotolerans DSM 20190 TaxID=1123500 RepID=A0A0R2FWD0_9LACO|nr:acyl carrier protein [Weissella halotolerans]KRN31718.1 hypothetical protein IV68_GL000974 [Weissella halotolerans DSM 20190]
MERKDVFNKVAALVADHFELDPKTVTEGMNLQSDVDADSIDFVELILEMEDEFDANISDDDAAQLITIADIVNYIMEQGQTK